MRLQIISAKEKLIFFLFCAARKLKFSIFLVRAKKKLKEKNHFRKFRKAADQFLFILSFDKDSKTILSSFLLFESLFF